MTREDFKVQAGEFARAVSAADKQLLSSRAMDAITDMLLMAHSEGARSETRDGIAACMRLNAKLTTERDRLQDALERIEALDFTKTERGGDDFYSGPARFLTAWNIARAVLGRKCSICGGEGTVGQSDEGTLAACPYCEKSGGDV